MHERNDGGKITSGEDEASQRDRGHSQDVSKSSAILNPKTAWFPQLLIPAG